MNAKQKAGTIDEYIAMFPDDVKEKLETIRSIVRNVAPDAVEKISYGMPAFAQNGILIWFAAHTNHIGFYPTASGIEHFKNEIGGYKSARGSVQFPLDKPLPVALIKKMVLFRVRENLVKGEKGGG